MDELCDQNLSEIDRLADKIDFSRLTPYDVMRLQNCKLNQFRKNESYPSIRPPASKCSNRKTGAWLAAAVAEAGCNRGFCREKKFDLLELWKHSPNKDSLSCYGLGGKKPKSDAILFNKAILKSLEKVNGIEVRHINKSKMEPAKKQKMRKSTPKGPYVLNRNVLQSVIKRIPTVIRKASPKAANTVLYCPKPEESTNAFEKDEPYFPLQVALDIVEPQTKPKCVLPRKRRVCNAKCGIPENECTQYEWLKYMENPGLQDKILEVDIASMSSLETPEPKNFDNLYGQLVSCFEKNPFQRSECGMYSQCCSRRSEGRALQGCGENEPPFGKSQQTGGIEAEARASA